MDTKGKDSTNRKGHAPRMPQRRYGYFRDDQIIFLVTHDRETVSANLLGVFREQVNRELGTSNGIVQLSPRIFSFPVINDENSEKRFAELQRLHHHAATENEAFANRPSPFQITFSMLICDLTNVPDEKEPLDLLDNITALRDALNGKDIVFSDHETPSIEPEKMTVQDVSPNWLMSVASQGSGTGGPGGLPRPFEGTDTEGSKLSKFTTFINRLTKLGLYGSGDGVDVAILDTVRPMEDLVLAPKDHPANDVLQGLLGPNGVLTPYYLIPAETSRMVNTSLNKHDYPMSDHGLFVAGIVHRLVPNAKIYLVQVLNLFGVGDLESLASGLKTVYEQIYKPGSGRKLVVNCSWMLDLPPSPEHCWADENDPEHDFEVGVEDFVKKEKEHAKAIWAVCNSLFYAGAQVVAAAGNDWDWAKQRRETQRISQAGTTTAQADEARENAPEARYPAGFLSAVGVGALPKRPRLKNGKYQASKYSNLGDKPAGWGIMTLGGEEGRKKGVLGLYLDQEYPVEKPNSPPPPPNEHRREFNMRRRNQSREKNSWGWWAGTSFATPLLTGTIAAVLSSPKQPTDTQQSLQLLYDNGVIEPDLTDAEEDVMLVTQDDELLKQSGNDDDD